MAWLDNRIWAHPKIRDVPRATRWEYAAALAYASGFGTKGVLTAGQLKAIECTPRDRELLIRVGLWEDASADGNDGAIRIHDWDDHNGKSDAKREADRKRKRAERAKTQKTSDGHGSDRSRTDRGQTVGPSEPGPRARARGRAPDDEVSSEEGPPAVEVRTESSTPKADAGLTRASFEPPAPASDTNALDTTDPINRLVLELRDRDEGTAHVLRTRYGGLAEAAFVYTREEVIRCRTDTDSDAGLATRILERITETGFIGDPDFAPTTNGHAAAPATRTPYERAELLVRNIGPTLEPRDLDRELDDIGITDQAEREQLHAILDQLRQADAA